MDEKKIYHTRLGVTANETLAEICYYLEQIDMETSGSNNLPLRILIEKMSSSRGAFIRLKQTLNENVKEDEIPQNIRNLLADLINLMNFIPEDAVLNKTEISKKLEEINIKNSELLRLFLDR